MSNDKYEFLDEMDDSYFTNKPVSDIDNYDDDENIFLRSSNSRSKKSFRGTKSMKQQNGDSESNSNGSKRITIVVVSFLLSSLFITALVGLGVWYKRSEAKKGGRLVDTSNVPVEIA